jgi:hypothetical protein
MPEEPHYPDSPDEVIDPRWNRYLHAQAPEGPAHHRLEGGEQLGEAMRAIIEPWEAGRRGSRETLQALRELADRVL